MLYISCFLYHISYPYTIYQMFIYIVFNRSLTIDCNASSIIAATGTDGTIDAEEGGDGGNGGGSMLINNIVCQKGTPIKLLFNDSPSIQISENSATVFNNKNNIIDKFTVASLVPSMLLKYTA